MADASLKGIINRLKLKQAMPRRLAIVDLVRRHAEAEADEQAQIDAALIAHAERERDEKALLKIIAHLGSIGGAEARAALAALKDGDDVPSEAAHAALLAHDRLERGGGGA
jgi:thioredoxin-like negative regulator of GroEL